MFLVPGDSAGLTRRRQHAIMFPGGDTSELFFDGVRIPADQLLGREGEGLRMFQPVISLDRMQICARSQGAAEAAFEMTLEHVRNRRLFGRRLVDFQNTQFKLAEMETDIAAGRAFLDRIIERYRGRNLHRGRHIHAQDLAAGNGRPGAGQPACSSGAAAGS